MKIKKDMYYKPRDIARLKLITSSRGQVSYNFVLDEIRAERLKAENRGGGKTPYFWVLGSDIIEYRKKNNLFISSEDETEESSQATPVA